MGRRRSSPGGSAGFIRRSPHLVTFWRDGQLWCANYATQTTVRVAPALLRLLDALNDWTSVADVAGRQSDRDRRVERVIDRLCTETLLERADAPDARPPSALDAWAGWNPVAGFFHMSTRDVVYREVYSKRTGRPLAHARTTTGRFSQRTGPARLRLPDPVSLGALGDVLRERRTWRRFGRRKLSLSELGTLLRLTWGVQRWRALDRKGTRIALKTYPSGGARHPLEVYVLALRVEGLTRGLYHFRADSHALTLLRPVAERAVVERYLPTQWWYAGAGALVFVAASFERMRQRYPYPRAYRAVLLEVGHSCQNFCLIATALGLAPFSTAACADSRIEGDLALDGIQEAVLYVCGVGTRPPARGRPADRAVQVCGRPLPRRGSGAPRRKS